MFTKRSKSFACERNRFMVFMPSQRNMLLDTNVVKTTSIYLLKYIPFINSYHNTLEDKSVLFIDGECVGIRPSGNCCLNVEGVRVSHFCEV